MTDQATEKQHQATSKRIEDLRRQGQIMRSRDLTSGMVFIVAVFGLIYMASSIKDTLETNFVLTFTSMKDILHSNGLEGGLLQKIAINNFLILLPIFALVMGAGLLSPYIFGGWNFSMQSVRFKGESLNPLHNLKNIFSKRIVFNVIKSMLKVAIILGVLSLFAITKKPQIDALINLPLTTAVQTGASIVTQFIILISASLLIIVLYDVVTTYFEYQKKIKMTSQELKDENKETEGNVDIKRKIRSMQFALMKQRLSLTVPKAHVIITNPTHYAVAIRYDDKKDKAPKVVAKGKDFVAQQIRQLAISNGIPIYQAPVLARAIFNTSKLGTEINPALYMGVAIILSYVHQLRNYQMGMGKQPHFVTDLKVPKEFVYE